MAATKAGANGNGKRHVGSNQHSPPTCQAMLPALNTETMPQTLDTYTDRHEHVARLVEHGMSINTACLTAQVPVASYYWWIEHGPNGQVDERSERHAWLRRLIAHRAMGEIHEIGNTLAAPWSWESLGCPDSKWGQVWAKALDSAYKCKLELAKRLLPDVYGDRLETRNVSVNVSYAVDFGATRASKGDKVIDVTPEAD